MNIAPHCQAEPDWSSLQRQFNLRGPKASSLSIKALRRTGYFYLCLTVPTYLIRRNIRSCASFSRPAWQYVPYRRKPIKLHPGCVKEIRSMETLLPITVWGRPRAVPSDYVPRRWLVSPNIRQRDPPLLIFQKVRPWASIDDDAAAEIWAPLIAYCIARYAALHPPLWRSQS